MASWPPAAVTIRGPEDKCDRQRGDSQRQRQANVSMANAMAPDRQPASTANDSQEERGASHCCCDPRDTDRRLRRLSLPISLALDQVHAAAKGLWGSVNVYTAACFGRP
jgi:hypothetical protein